jgi:hypothetical protein
LIFPLEAQIFTSRYTFFGKQQEVETIICPTCGRKYSIVLLPYGIAPEDPMPHTQEKQNIRMSRKIASFIDQYSSLDVLIPKFTNWKTFFLFNWLLILVTLSEFFTNHLLLFTSFLLLLMSEIVIIISLPSFSDFLKKAFDIQDVPLLFHQKYITTRSFAEFKNSFFESNMRQSQNRELTQFLFIVISVTIWGTFLSVTYVSIVGSSNLINSLLGFILTFGVFLWLFYLTTFFILFTPLLADTLYYLRFVSRSIPFKLDPWEENQKIEVFKQLWLWSFTVCLFILITVPIILEMNNVVPILEGFIANKNLENILSAGGNLFIVLSVLTLILITIFIKIIYDLNKNIERRKKELLLHIKCEVNSIRSLNCPSNRDIFRGTLLLKKADKINAISTFSVKQLIGFTITLISFIAPVILNFLK